MASHTYGVHLDHAQIYELAAGHLTPEPRSFAAHNISAATDAASAITAWIAAANIQKGSRYPSRKKFATYIRIGPRSVQMATISSVGTMRCKNRIETKLSTKTAMA